MSFDQLQKDAVTASQYTGVDSLVVLSQMVNENGWDVPNGYNFGNIQYYGGPDQSGYFTTPSGQKIATYASEQAGLSAYVNLINSNYSQIAQVKGDSAQLKALQASPWDAGHYPNIGAVYNSVAAKAAGIGSVSPMALDSTQQQGSAGSISVGSLLSNVSAVSWVLIGIAFVILLGVFL